MAYTDCCGSNRILTAKIVSYMIFKPQSNRSGLYVNNVMLRSNRSLNLNLNRSLYIINGDVMQTAAVQTTAVCLGQKLP